MYLQKLISKKHLVDILKITDKNSKSGSGFISQRYGSADPDPPFRICTPKFHGSATLVQVSIDNLLDTRQGVVGSRGNPHAVAASCSVDGGAIMSRSLQSWPSGGSRLSGLRRSASLEVDQQSLDDSILQIPKLRLKRTIRRMSAQAHQQHKKTTRLYPPPSSTKEDDSSGESRPPQSAVLDQLFDFIGSHPEAAVSPWRFLAAVNVRRERSVARHYALVYMKQLLMAGGGAGVEVAIPPAHLVNSVASLLRAGPRLQAGSVSDSQVWIRIFQKVSVSQTDST
jgi:hypothetical protein